MACPSAWHPSAWHLLGDETIQSQVIANLLLTGICDIAILWTIRTLKGIA